MKSVKNLCKLLAFFFIPSCFAAPWNGGIEVGTSVAHSYGSRNLFSNPAAMAFETELNGRGLLSSFTYASTFDNKSEFSLSHTYSYFGASYERLYQGGESYSRYQLGLSYSLYSNLFIGTKFSTTSSELSSLSGNRSWDSGIQYRPFYFWSLGLTASQLNQPSINALKTPTVYTLATVIRPREWLTLTTDIETASNQLFTSPTYQGTLCVEPILGLTLSSGYQSDHRFQVGVQLDLGRASIFSVLHASPKESVRASSPKYIIGFQTSIKPLQTVVNQPSELVITLDESLNEEGKDSTFLSKAKPSLLDILESIHQATENSWVERISIKLESFPLGLGAAEELAEALLKARDKGKKIEVFLTSAKTKDYLIASAASTIYLEPSGEITLLGPRMAHYFAKGTLDKIGVQGEFLAKGDYKSAPETFTQRESSLKSKEATQHELKEMEKALHHIFERTRKISTEQMTAWLNHAVFSSEDALKQKLIDKMGSYSEINNTASSTGTFYPSTHYAQKTLALRHRISVITANGNILQKKTRLLSMTGQSQVTPDALEPLFQRAINDPRTQAIVFRVSSSGGEVLASEQIATLVSKARAKKPVIVSMGDMAASGGYLISAPANSIFADRLTFTGSIGVFLGKFNLAGLYQKLDLRKEVVGLGPYSALDSEAKAWTKAERGLMARRLNRYYDGFVDFVAKQRNISKELAEKAAQGRVWMGEESVGLKIIDKTGGILDAIAAAKLQTGLKTEFDIYPIRESVGIFEAISEETMPGVSLDLNTLGLFVDKNIQKQMAQIAWISQNSFLYFAPDL